MLQPQFLLLAAFTLLLVGTSTAAPFEQDIDNDDGIGNTEDGYLDLNYDTYQRYKRQDQTSWPTQKMGELLKIPKCGPGYFFPDCEPCAIGYYKPSKARKPCARCGSTKGTPDEGARWCTNLCKPGERLLDDAPNAKRNCTKCEIGKYQPNPNVDFSCISCPEGKTTAKEGSQDLSDCFLNCPAGMQPNSDETDCVLCPEGTYKKNIGPVMCSICTKNRTTPEDGAVLANQCKVPCNPGREYNATSGRCDIRCEPGTYKGEISSRTKCRPCPENFVPNQNKAATGCVPLCGPGYELNGSQDNCTACRFGYYKTATGNLACEACPGGQMTLSKATSSSEDCQDFNACAKPLVENLESLFSHQDMVDQSESFIDFMLNICSLGPFDEKVIILENIVASFPTCGVVGQINLGDVVIGGNIYKKERYLQILKEAYSYGGMCSFVSCLGVAVPEIQKSKSWMKNDSCPTTETSFCSETYRALATSFHTNLQMCPALQFHQEFLAVDIGGPEMIESLLTAPNISDFCALSNDCADVNCGHGTCINLVTGGYECKCWFGYTGENCQIAQPATQETEPDTTSMKTTRATLSPVTCDCPTPTELPQCPTNAPCPECSTCECPTATPLECPICPTCPTVTCPTTESRLPCECPTQTDPPQCPTSTPCPECPTSVPPTPCECPTLECPTPTPCPTSTPCPVCPTTTSPLPCECPTPTECPTTTACPNITCPTFPAPTPCECQCPTSAPCPTVTCPTSPPTTPCECPVCPTSTQCPECPTAPSPTPCQCPTSTECPTPPPCPTSTPCPTVTCPTTQPPTPCECPTTTECPTPPPCPTSTPCPTVTCPTTQPPTPCECPTTTECPTPPPCPTSTPCPTVTCPTTQPPAPCECPTTTECPTPPLCPTSTPCPTIPPPTPCECPTETEPPPCPTNTPCPECPTTAPPTPCPTAMPSEPVACDCSASEATTSPGYTPSYNFSTSSDTIGSTDPNSAETQRCGFCESQMLYAYFAFGKTICSQEFAETINCFINSGCSGNFLNEKYPLYSLIVPPFLTGPWGSFYDMQENQIAYCQSDEPETSTGATAANSTVSSFWTTYSQGAAMGQEIIGTSCVLHDYCHVFGAVCHFVETQIRFICRCPLVEQIYDSSVAKCVPEFQTTSTHLPSTERLSTAQNQTYSSFNTDVSGTPEMMTTSAPTTANPSWVSGQAIQGTFCDSQLDCERYGANCSYHEMYGSYCTCPHYAPYYDSQYEICIEASSCKNTDDCATYGAVCQYDSRNGDWFCQCPEYSPYFDSVTRICTSAYTMSYPSPKESSTSSYISTLSASSSQSTGTSYSTGESGLGEEIVGSACANFDYCHMFEASCHYKPERIEWVCVCPYDAPYFDGTTCVSGGTTSSSLDPLSTGPVHGTTELPGGTTSSSLDPLSTGPVHGTTELPVLDSRQKCDIREPWTCVNGLTCMMEWNSDQAFCECAEFGMDNTTGQCRTSMPVLHDICDPSAIYPCSPGQECKETAAGLEPTCNCKQGYYEDFDYCMMEPLPNVGETCDPNAVQPCADTYTQECRQTEGINNFTCVCKNPYILNSYGYCERMYGGFMYDPCMFDSECQDTLFCRYSLCQCNDSYISFDQMSCVYADGMKLGGHCHLYDLCYVNGSKCNFTSHTCECRFGYEQTDDHTCSRIPDVPEECTWDSMVCKSLNEQCFDTLVNLVNRTETMRLCDCSIGFVRDAAGKCVLDLDKECDFRKNTCSHSMNCVIDAETSRATCQCLSHGMDHLTGLCRENGAMVDEHCEPEALYPCWDYYTECNRTDPSVTPTCKCKKGYFKTGPDRCERASAEVSFPEYSAQLDETCDPHATYPCTDQYSMECKQTTGTAKLTCQCKNGFQSNGDWCERKIGYLYAQCNNGSCSAGLNCTSWNTCDCPANYSSFDETTCSRADGFVLGGHCYMWQQCFMNNSVCDYNAHTTCQCLYGFQDAGNNTCIRTPGTEEGCSHGGMNCLPSDNKQCYGTYLRLDGRTEYINLCDCLEGYVKVNDACQPDLSSCTFCFQSFDKALQLFTSRTGCSQNMTEAVECFSANCNDEEFEIYREEINSRLFMYHYYVTTVGELKTLYDQYCAGHLLEKQCDASTCYIYGSSCIGGICICNSTFTMVNASQCLSNTLQDYYCYNDDYMCTYLNAICMGEKCACPEGYGFDITRQQCGSASNLGEECNVHMSDPCNGPLWYPRCEYDPKTELATCKCGSYGFNTTSQTCADHPAKANEMCTLNAEQPCESGAECETASGKCKCKAGYSTDGYGYCVLTQNNRGILNYECDIAPDGSYKCSGENVECNVMTGYCECRTDESYYQNYYNYSCYISWKEDGNIGSPCQYTYYCDDPNAQCEYPANNIPTCQCKYGYIYVDGHCEKDPGIPEDCLMQPCMDENAVCKSFDMWFDQRYVYAAFCVCKNGYRKEAGSVGGKCQPGNCDGCLQEFLKLDITMGPGLCQKGVYSVMRCATEKQCSDSSNFGNIMSSHQVQLLRPMLNLTDIASLKASYKSMCDGQVAGGHCDTNNECSADLGLECFPGDGENSEDSYCKCIYGSDDSYGQCLEKPPSACDIRKPACSESMEECLFDEESNKSICQCVQYGKDPLTGQCKHFPAYYGELCDHSALHPCEDGYWMECKEAYDLTASTCECKEGMTFGTYGFCEEDMSSSSQLNEVCDPKSTMPCSNRYNMECKLLTGEIEPVCRCDDNHEVNPEGWCVKKPGYLYAVCDSGACYNGLNCSTWNICECPFNYISFDEKTCVHANGTVLGGHCHMWSNCYVKYSVCDSHTQYDNSKQQTCRCLYGYKDSGSNACVRIPGTKEECQADQSNCLASDNKECIGTYMRRNNQTEHITLCECKLGYIKDNFDRCVPDLQSCDHCYNKLYTALNVASYKQGCSKNMTEVLECFQANCNYEEFDRIKDELHMSLFMGLFMSEYHITTLSELQPLYDEYCAGNMLERSCDVGSCYIPDSMCINETCRCNHSYTVSHELAKCLPSFLPDYYCTDDEYYDQYFSSCSHLNAICMDGKCVCPENYGFDVYKQQCGSTAKLYDECNILLYDPCVGDMWWPRCEFETTTGLSTCKCGQYGFNITSQTCADYPARANEPCNIGTEQPCEYRAECTSGLCECKDGYSRDEYGYCMLTGSDDGTLNHNCAIGANGGYTCTGENVECNVMTGLCDCKTDDSYYQNTYNNSCYRSSREDGNIGSPCQHSWMCNDANAQCDYPMNNIPSCHCVYGYINVNGHCERDPGLPDDCMEYSCKDINAVCKGQEIRYDQWYAYRSFCVCKNGYRRETALGNCLPDNCDGCLQEFLKLDLHPLCQKGGYTVIKCAVEKQCTDASNFGKIVSLYQLQEYAYQLNLTDISSLKSSYKSICDGQVAGGHCDVYNQCNSTLGLQCVPEVGDDWETTYCRCISGYADMWGKCLEDVPSDTGAASTVGQQIPGSTCNSDFDCNIYNAKCIQHEAYDSCHCTARQMLDGEICLDGFCPSSSTGCGEQCFYTEECAANKICCPDPACIEHCVVPRFSTNACQICLEDFNMLDLSIELCQKGGYQVHQCFVDAGCDERTQIVDLLTDHQLLQYGYILNFTSLDALYDSYGRYCDGQVAGGHCDINNECNEDLGLECVPGDGLNSEDSYCKCIHGSDDSYGQCLEKPPSACDIRKPACSESMEECLFDEESNKSICQCVQYGKEPLTGQCKHFPAYYGELCDPGALHPCEDNYGMECKEGYDLTTPICECKEGLTLGPYGYCEEDVSSSAQLNEVCDPKSTMPCANRYNMECKLLSGGTDPVCRCDDNHEINPEGWCDKKPGYLYAVCDSGACYNGLNCSTWNSCECPLNYTSFDEKTCVHANGTVLGGHCYMWSYCYVKYSVCGYHTQYDNNKQHTCRCLYGYKDFESNACVRIPGIKEECQADQSNCLAADNKECIGTYIKRNNQTEHITLCECKLGYMKDNFDRCVPDLQSCDHCYNKFYTALYVSSYKQGCSKNMTELIECFQANCNYEEFDRIKDDLHIHLFMGEYYIATLSELQPLYDEYCAGYMLERSCDVGSCYIPDSMCINETCRCNPSYTISHELAQCLPSFLPDHYCTDEQYYDHYDSSCSHLNAVCMDGKCVCPEGYDFDVYKQQCGSTAKLYEECNIFLYDPCAGNTWWPRCEFDTTTGLSTCKCGQYGYNITSQTCADYPARANQPCNIGTEQPCDYGAECSGGLCKCKDGYSRDEYGYCMLTGSDYAVLNNHCAVGENGGYTCTGENVECNVMTGFCDCKKDDFYYQNTYNNSCYRSSSEDGNIGSPCQHSWMCNDANAMCDYPMNNIASCHCVYGYINVNGLCQRDPGIPDDCMEHPCEDANAVCKGQDIRYDQWYAYRSFCVCKNGYRRETASGNCLPDNCDGCLQEFMKLDLPPLCQKGVYTVINCAVENECTDDSNFGKIVSAYPLQEYAYQLNLTDISSLKSSYKSICDGLVAGGHCDVDNQCNATLGLQCVPEGGVDWEKSYCQCISGYADMSGKCFEVAPSDTGAASTVGQQIPGSTCTSDFDCSVYNAKCIQHDTYNSCHCNARQMFDGGICLDGFCPSSVTSCGEQCFYTEECPANKICCPDPTCIEHCVVPQFWSNACQTCLNEFYMLDMSTDLCQKGGYQIHQCLVDAGCDERTQIVELLTASQLLQYDFILNFTSLTALFDSYENYCNGKVAGGSCDSNGMCESMLSLECVNNNQCRCLHSTSDDEFGRCIDAPQDPCQVCLDEFNALDLSSELCQKGGYIVIQCTASYACGEATIFASVLNSPKLLQYNHILNLKNLDTLGDSYKAYCDGKVAGGSCDSIGMCDSMLSLECVNNSHCRCLHSAADDEFGRCIDAPDLCQVCLDAFNALDLSSQLCQKGGYFVSRCTELFGCGEVTVFASVLHSPKLLQYNYILDLTNLDTLGNSYKAYCDGKVAGSNCNAYGLCDASLGLKCHHPDEFFNQNSQCQCKVPGEDEYGRCFNYSSVWEDLSCQDNAPCASIDGYCDLQTSLCRCPSNQPFDSTTNMCGSEIFMQYVCYEYTTEEYNMMETPEINLTEREVCERKPGRVFTSGYVYSLYPNCNGCSCCKDPNFIDTRDQVAALSKECDLAAVNCTDRLKQCVYDIETRMSLCKCVHGTDSSGACLEQSPGYMEKCDPALIEPCQSQGWMKCLLSEESLSFNCGCQEGYYWSAYGYCLKDSGPGTLRAECNDGACNENMYCDGYTCVCMPGYVSNYDGTKCTLEVFGDGLTLDGPCSATGDCSAIPGAYCDHTQYQPICKCLIGYESITNPGQCSRIPDVYEECTSWGINCLKGNEMCRYVRVQLPNEVKYKHLCLCDTGYKRDPSGVCLPIPDRCADEGIICDGNADCITLVEMAPYCQCKLGYSGDGYNCYAVLTENQNLEEDCDIFHSNSCSNLLRQCVYDAERRLSLCKCTHGTDGTGSCLERSPGYMEKCDPAVIEPCQLNGNLKCLLSQDSSFYNCDCKDGYYWSGYGYCYRDYSPGTLWATCDAGACNENMFCDMDYCVCISGYVSNYDGNGCSLEVIGDGMTADGPCSPSGICPEGSYCDHTDYPPTCKCLVGYESITTPGTCTRILDILEECTTDGMNCMKGHEMCRGAKVQLPNMVSYKYLCTCDSGYERNSTGICQAIPDPCIEAGIVCDVNADCISDPGMNPYCQCKLGFFGDGINCSVVPSDNQNLEEEECDIWGTVSCSDWQKRCVYVEKKHRTICQCIHGKGPTGACLEQSPGYMEKCDPAVIEPCRSQGQLKCMFSQESLTYYCKCQDGYYWSAFGYCQRYSGPGTLWAECDAGTCNANMSCDANYCNCMPGYIFTYDGFGCVLEVIGDGMTLDGPCSPSWKCLGLPGAYCDHTEYPSTCKCLLGYESITAQGTCTRIPDTLEECASDGMNCMNGNEMCQGLEVQLPTGIVYKHLCVCYSGYIRDAAGVCVPGTASSTTPATGYLRTVILMHYSPSSSDEQLFIRGGMDHSLYPECASAADLYTSGCVIPIMHNFSGNGTNYEKYNAWSEGDFYLDWAGPETTQGLFSGQPAEGTPTVRTTNISGEGYSYLNTYGDNYWLVDFYMQCDQTRDDGWFDIKGYVSAGGSGFWENDANLVNENPCYTGVLPTYSTNHKAKCGMMNVFTFDNYGLCDVKPVPQENTRK